MKNCLIAWKGQFCQGDHIKLANICLKWYLSKVSYIYEDHLNAAKRKENCLSNAKNNQERM
ncbi:hypothetical protein CR513_30724, partial [Mucuna pruriens]